VTLSQDRGKNVVLLFYPAAFTGVCTKEMCTVAEDFGSYQALDAEVLAISVDTPWVVTKFAAESNATFPFLSDFNKTVIEAYDVLRRDFAFGMKGVAERAVFVVNREGAITYAWRASGRVPRPRRRQGRPPRLSAPTFTTATSTHRHGAPASYVRNHSSTVEIFRRINDISLGSMLPHVEHAVTRTEVS
jgi:peroxiredoxin